MSVDEKSQIQAFVTSPMKIHTTTYTPTHTISVTHTLEEPRAATSINSRAQLAEYVSRGFILLTPEDLGVDASIHPRIHQQTTKALNALEQQRAKRQDTAPSGAVRSGSTRAGGQGTPSWSCSSASRWSKKRHTDRCCGGGIGNRKGNLCIPTLLRKCQSCPRFLPHQGSRLRWKASLAQVGRSCPLEAV